MVPQRRFHKTRMAQIFTRQAQRIYRPVYAKGVVIRPGAGDDDGTWYTTRAFGWRADEARAAAAEEQSDEDDEPSDEEEESEDVNDEADDVEDEEDDE